MRQQHPARADADAPRRGAQRAEQHLGRAAANERNGVMLRHPIAVIAQRVGMTRHRHRVGEDLRRATIVVAQRLVENGNSVGH